MTVLLEDTRQHKGKHETKHVWWGKHDVALIRCKLAFGDYCPPPPVSVDTKADVYELAYDIDHDHERFKRELVGARDAGVKLVVLVENEDGLSSLEDLAGWNETQEHFAKRGKAKRRLRGARLAKACATMQTRYGVQFQFCAPHEAAARVIKILSGGAE